MKKLCMLLVAVLAVALMMGFVGCKQEDDVPSGPAVVATWRGAHNDENFELTAWDDKSWEILRVYDSSISTLYASGTYTGDATKGGELKCTITDGLAGIRLRDTKVTFTISGKTLAVPAILVDSQASGTTINFTRK